MRPTVFIETTVVSYLTARPSNDLVRAAHQQITREWWDSRRADFDLLTSELVRIEAAAGDPAAAADRLGVLAPLPLLDITDRALDLADLLLAAAALPTVAARDAQHLAVAATNGIDYLLTWNCRHLANATLRTKIEDVCLLAGLRPPLICTPEELLGDLP